MRFLCKCTRMLQEKNVAYLKILNARNVKEMADFEICEMCNGEIILQLLDSMIVAHPDFQATGSVGYSPNAVYLCILWILCC